MCHNTTMTQPCPACTAETTMQTALPVTSAFVGCIQDMTVNSEPVSFDKLPGVFGAINVRECPG